MADTGWLFPRVFGTHAGHSSVGYGTKSWYATPYIAAVDGQVAYLGPPGTSLANGESTEWLRAEDFSPDIPADAIITGVAVRYFLRRTSGSAQLNAVCIRRGGQFLAETVRRPRSDIPPSFIERRYGDENSLWGIALTRAMLLDKTFGFVLQCKATAGGSNVAVDYVQARYYYTVDETIVLGHAAGRGSASIGNVVLGGVAPALTPAVGRGSARLSACISGSITVSPGVAAGSGSASIADIRLGTNFRWSLNPAHGIGSASISGVISGSVDIALSPARGSGAAVPPRDVLFSSLTVPFSPAPGRGSASLRGLIVKIPIAMPTAYGRGTASIADVRTTWSQIRLYPDFFRNSQQSMVLATPVLVTIDHPDLPQPERFTNAGIPIESRGNLYEAIPFDVRFPTGGRNQISEAVLTLPLQSRRIRGTYRNLPEPRPVVTLEIVQGDDPDTLADDPRIMRMVSDQTGGGVMMIILDDGDFERNRFPPLIFDGRWAAVHD